MKYPVNTDLNSLCFVVVVVLVVNVGVVVQFEKLRSTPPKEKKLSKREHSAWSYWIRKYFLYRVISPNCRIIPRYCDPTEMLKMMGKVSNEPPVMDAYSYMFIQPEEDAVASKNFGK